MWFNTVKKFAALAAMEPVFLVVNRDGRAPSKILEASAASLLWPGALAANVAFVTTVTLQTIISGIQFFAYRVSKTGIAKGATAFFFVV
jgi:hypothetical protein